jgi:hypothetical protein
MWFLLCTVLQNGRISQYILNHFAPHGLYLASPLPTVPLLHYTIILLPNWLKGQYHEIFWFWFFFIRHLLLVPLDTPRKDFVFFRIAEELFEFVIDPLVYSLPGSRDSPMYSLPGSHDSPLYASTGSWDSPVVNTPGSWPKLVTKELFAITVEGGPRK